jgi:hypothetical protein
MAVRGLWHQSTNLAMIEAWSWSFLSMRMVGAGRVEWKEGMSRGAILQMGNDYTVQVN